MFHLHKLLSLAGDLWKLIIFGIESLLTGIMSLLTFTFCFIEFLALCCCFGFGMGLFCFYYISGRLGCLLSLTGGVVSPLS